MGKTLSKNYNYTLIMQIHNIISTIAYDKRSVRFTFFYEFMKLISPTYYDFLSVEVYWKNRQFKHPK